MDLTLAYGLGLMKTKERAPREKKLRRHHSLYRSSLSFILDFASAALGSDGHSGHGASFLFSLDNLDEF